MSWPPPVPLRSPPGSFRPVHTRPGWLCSDPQLPGSLDLLGRVACHLSCWSGGGGFRTRSGVHLAERKPGPGGRERVPVGSSRFLASPIPPPQQDGLGRRAAWPSVQVSLLPPLSPSGEPCHFSFWGVTQAGLGSGLLGVPRAQLRHPGWGWLAPLALPLRSCCPAEPPSAGRPSRSLPTSARALGGSLFLGHKAPLILCSAPSHVTRWAGRARRRPAQPDSAAG